MRRLTDYGVHWPAAVLIALLLLYGIVWNHPVSGAETISTNGTLMHVDRSDPESLDPTVGTGTASQEQGLLMFDTLLAKDNQLRLVPLLATSWRVSADGKTYTFALRKDVEFHSGHHMTSADVRYSLERLKDKQTGSPFSYLLAIVDRVETPDPATVVVHLTRPDRLFLDVMSNPATSVVNRESVEKAGKEFGRTVVDGTGPFKLVSHVFNEHIVYERFDKYRWGPAGYQNRGPARIRRLVWRVVPELTTAELMLENGEVDLFTHNTDPSLLARAPGLRGWVEVTRRPVTDTRGLILNTAFPHLKDLAVRQAIVRTVDRQLIAASILFPTGTPAVDILHPLAYGYWKGIERVVPAYDPAKAKQLLDAAGWRVNAEGFREKGGVVLKGLKLMGLPRYQDIAVVIKESLAAIGIGADIQLLERGRLYPLRRAGGVEMEIYNFEGTADEFDQYLLSTNVPGTNPFGWKDARTDRWIETFHSAPDERTALDAAAQLQKMVVADEALVAPIYWITELNLVNSRTLRDFTGAVWLNTALGKLLDVWSVRTQ
jgi:ABC-type transport system substrate-binding protein